MKYGGTSCYIVGDEEGSVYFILAGITEHTGEAAEVLGVSEEVPEDSPVPEGF